MARTLEEEGEVRAITSVAAGRVLPTRRLG